VSATPSQDVSPAPSATPAAAQPVSTEPQPSGGFFGQALLILGLIVVVVGLGLWAFFSLRR